MEGGPNRPPRVYDVLLEPSADRVYVTNSQKIYNTVIAPDFNLKSETSENFMGRFPYYSYV